MVTEWEHFKRLTPDDFTKYMAQPVVVDARRIFDPELFSDRLTFTAVGLGEGLLSTGAR